MLVFRSYKSRKRLKQDENANGTAESKAAAESKAGGEDSKDGKDKEATVLKVDKLEEVVSNNKTEENGSKSPSRPPKADSVPPVKSPVEAPTPMETDDTDSKKEESAEVDDKSLDPSKTISA